MATLFLVHGLDRLIVLPFSSSRFPNLILPYVQVQLFLTKETLLETFKV